MLRLVNAGNATPISYLVDPTDFFEPGMIGSLTGRVGGRDICGRSKGTMPIGIIDDIRNGTDDSTLVNKRITIWNEAVVAETDMFDHLGIYSVGCDLGVSFRGLFSPVLSDIKTSGVVAKVIVCPTVLSGAVRFQWIPQVIHSHIPTLSMKISISAKGVYCIQCNTLNEYLDIGNQLDGSYKCYHCRNY